MGVSQPAGEVTLVFSDIEGSTKLLEELGTSAYREALAEHRRIVRQACARHAGYEVDYEGDAFFYAFSSAPEAVAAVSEAMAGLEEGPIRIRVGIHTGEPGLDPPKYVGMDVHFAARVMSAAHGGQIVLSAATAEHIEAELSDLGEHRLKDIEEAIPLYQLGDGSFPPLKTISNTNLPRPASSFVGREAELAEVLSRIEGGARLVTLTGPGGTGKTRLALEAASSLVPSYKAGVFWVGLASLRDPALVTETISQTLGAKDGLAEHIGERELLLLLDNLEQVIEAAPELSSLLSACPNLTLLVTSRELLRIQGEVEYSVPTLVEPEAVSLFCERAQLESSDEIAEICVRLDSLPLAVELAAARVKALSPAQILERLSQRLDLLKGGRDADPRQQTLRATIEWSYELLSLEEQQLFARLSVFRGGCTLEAAEEVADADLDTLQSLVEKSLLRFTNERYWMLETIREYAGQCLSGTSEFDAIVRRFVSVTTALTERANEGLQGARFEEGVAAITNELPNVRASLTWASQHEHRFLHRLVGALWLYWRGFGYASEGIDWLKRALATSPASEERCRILGGLSWLYANLGDYDSAELVAWERLGLAEELGDVTGTVGSYALLALTAESQGQLDSAESLLERCSAIDGGYKMRYNHATFLVRQGRYESAVPLLETIAGDAREEDDAHMVTLCDLQRARIAIDTGRPHDALLPLSDALGSVSWVPLTVAESLSLLGLALIALGRHADGIPLLGAAETIRAEMQWSLPESELEPLEATLATVRLSHGEAAVEEWRAAGRAMSLDEAVEYALASID